jgi:hypothetical protein
MRFSWVIAHANVAGLGGEITVDYKLMPGR